ncbi:unnamed protein product [Chondrus crispus]|uniref:Uncharacterized protein n=1 Tax=Chondrus crispus TaxID=2769 RepID=R7QAZ0_CHOCR|nr:unnamed protein product [Chondrus crispus]CDF34943.1 unnamed protein product [Chondrus crispus]|eukprot:XP_005714762.1 unnamed protein product [Chondrus crispus]
MRISTTSALARVRVLCPSTQSRRNCILFLAAATILLAIFPIARELRPSTQPADSCHLIGINPAAKELWQFSTRSLCLSSSICLNAGYPGGALYHASSLSSTKCHVDNQDFSATNVKWPSLLNSTQHTCSDFQYGFVYCAHGTDLRRALPVCPKVRPLSISVLQTARWYEDISILIPDYAYSRNMYHFANPVLDLVRVVEHLEVLLDRWGKENVRGPGGLPYFKSRTARVKQLRLFFQGSKSIPLAHRWKREFMLMLIQDRMEQRGLNVTLYFLPDIDDQSGHLCFRNALIMGRRGHYDVWPFPNSTEVPLDGFSVPEEAVSLKRTVYKNLDIRTRLPSAHHQQAKTAVSEVPPLTVAYAKREGKPSSDGHYKAGAMRKFFDDDEKWFADMLKNETDAAGAKLVVISASSAQNLTTQVKDIFQAGFIVGIHGANLVNSMFMLPFGVLMEIFPNSVDHKCYMAGSNSGLKYLSFEASEQAGVVESGCYYKDSFCKSDPRQRRVKLGAIADRTMVRELFKEGIQHLLQLRRRFPDGIPVRYNRGTMYFEIKESV